jgi:hypothetical protein
VGAVDDSPAAPSPDGRLVGDLQRLEEYSAYHSDTYDALGNWPADRFEAAWESFVTRRAYETLATDERSLVAAAYANGNLGGDDLKEQVEGITRTFDEARERLAAGLSREDLSTIGPEDRWWTQRADTPAAPDDGDVELDPWSLAEG